jgi:hypothetical protein
MAAARTVSIYHARRKMPTQPDLGLRIRDPGTTVERKMRPRAIIRLIHFIGA